MMNEALTNNEQRLLEQDPSLLDLISQVNDRIITRAPGEDDLDDIRVNPLQISDKDEAGNPVYNQFEEDFDDDDDDVLVDEDFDDYPEEPEEDFGDDDDDFPDDEDDDDEYDDDEDYF